MRFVEVGMGGWDHRNLREVLPAKCREIDKPIAALLADLAGSGMLERRSWCGAVSSDGPRMPRTATDGTTTTAASPHGWLAAA